MLLEPCQKIEISADADNLSGTIERAAEILDHRRPIADRMLLAPHIGSFGIAQQPILPTEYPGLRIMRFDHGNRLPGSCGRQSMRNQGRQIGRRQQAAIEAGDRRRDRERLDQHAQSEAAAGC